MNRRDWLLNEMQITQWVLTKPQVLKGDAQICLPLAVKLVVICEEAQQSSGLFQDVLFTLNLKPDAFQWVNVEQFQRLTFNHHPIVWLISDNLQAVKMLEKFTENTVWKNVSWQELSNIATKRQLWQQINTFCHHLEEDL